MTAETAPTHHTGPALAAATTIGTTTKPVDALLPRRAPADPTDEAERLGDWGLLTGVLDALTAEGLESCPGLLVVHDDGRVECVEGDRCPPDPVMHAGTVACAQVLDGCC